MQRGLRHIRPGLMMLFLLLPLSLEAQSAERPRSAPASGAETAAGDPGGADASPTKVPDDTVDDATQRRTELNLLGQTDTGSGESRRNENVQFNLIDNNALKEMNLRLGATATIVEEFEAGRGYFGSEYGGQPTSLVHVPVVPSSGVHGSLFGSHNNSIFTARSFFQVGDVQPARENHYGLAFSAPLWKGGSVSLDASQQKIRGNVNGNVLVPRPDERTPLTNDPEIRPIVMRYLAAYPSEAPNRPDIDERALNTNAPQRINTDDAGVRLDQAFQEKDRLILEYRFTSQGLDAFQLVAGQNPDTQTRSHRARITWNRSWSAATVTDFSAGFDRLGSLLIPEPNAVDTFVSLASAIEALGPSPVIPIDRAQNTFAYAGSVRHTSGAHLLTGGFELDRVQYNGSETDAHRGISQFTSDFNRDVITNLRMGTATYHYRALGSTHRGFRNWLMHYYVGDTWRASSNLTLNFGLGYSPVTRPVEVDGLSELHYDCDCNNFAPRFGFAYRTPGRWGVLRGAYGIHYGQIFPITYGQPRLNPPNNIRVFVPQPYLADPLGGRTFEDFDPTARSGFVEISDHLVVPYSHQYNFSWETAFSDAWRLQLGYVGSRTHKLFMTWFTNRAHEAPGLSQTSETINDRRADSRYFEYLRVMNGSLAYFDAARASLVLRQWQGLSLNASYWFSKAIDLGTNYTNNAGGVDSRRGRSQSEFFVHADLKALSEFDQPHAFLLQAAYQTPRRGGWRGQVFGSWNVSAVLLAKTGTPFSVLAGSDAPGFGNVDGEPGDRPHIVDPSILGRTIGDPDTSRELLPREAFAFMQPTDLAGNLGNFTFRKGKIANVNAALSRTFSLSSEKKLTFRAESINFFNTPQFAVPSVDLTSPSFGKITNTLNDGRTFRFLLRFDF